METKNNIFEEHLQEWLKARGNKKKREELTRHIVFVTKMHPEVSPSALKNIIPIRKGPWKDTLLGDGQLDTALHCGETFYGMRRKYVSM